MLVLLLAQFFSPNQFSCYTVSVLLPAHNETSVFNVHSLDGKVWTFDAQYAEEMLGWTKAIGLQIKKCLEDFVLPNKREVRNVFSMNYRVLTQATHRKFQTDMFIAHCIGQTKLVQQSYTLITVAQTTQ